MASPSKRPMMILKQCFMRDGQSMASFAAELREVKALPDYREFVEQCAAHLAVECDWS